MGVLIPAGVPHLVASRLPAPSGPPADAILVLTGGENRIKEGYRAWKEGKGRELFILGTGGGARIERILPGKPSFSPEELGKLHVEGWSGNTLENAYSAKGVVSDRRFTRVILVTSGYHMPRAHLALRTIIPAGVSIAVIPVKPETREWGGFLRVAKLYFIEGWKYWGYRLFLMSE